MNNPPMPLPVLNAHSDPTRQDLVRFFHRTDLHWARHLGEETQLDVGVAIANSQLSAPPANSVRDASLPPDTPPAVALELVHSHFAAGGARCRQWTMNPSSPEASTAPLVRELLATGHWVVSEEILYLPRPPRGAIPHAPGLTIIPARASYRHVRELAGQVGASPEEWELHLDDPHWDCLLALAGTTVVGTVGVLAVGDIGRVDQLCVAPTHRRQGIGKTLLSRALEICARSLFKHVFTHLPPDDAPAGGLFKSIGFEQIGGIVRYTAP